MDDLRNKKCPRCRCYRFNVQFIAKDRLMKTCSICRDNGKKYNDKCNKDIMLYNQLIILNQSTEI